MLEKAATITVLEHSHVHTDKYLHHVEMRYIEQMPGS